MALGRDQTKWVLLKQEIIQGLFLRPLCKPLSHSEINLTFFKQLERRG